MRRDRYHAVTQMYHFGAETHLDAVDTSAFVMPSAAISRVLPLTFVAIVLVQLSRKAHKYSDTRDHSRSLTLTCETHCNNFLSSHLPPLLVID